MNEALDLFFFLAMKGLFPTMIIEHEFICVLLLWCMPNDVKLGN